MADCILCGRCTDACQQTQQIGAIGINGRGPTAHIGSAFDSLWEDSTCTSCGQCVSQCPTGALLPRVGSPRAAGGLPPEDQDVVHTTCPYCGVGCGLAVSREEGRLSWVNGEPDNASSLGMTCVKGRFGLGYAQSGDRLTTPLVRRGGELRPASWEEALDLVARRFTDSLGSFASIASAKATNEDGYIQQKFVRAVMGTNSIDHCSRLCHAPSVVAMIEQIGSGATSNSYEDYDHAGTLLVVGSDNLPESPGGGIAIARRSARARRRPRGRQPRSASSSAMSPASTCSRVPAPMSPSSNAMAQVILAEGLEDRPFIRERTEGFDAWRRVAEQVTPELAEQLTGVPAEQIREAARLYARPRPGRDGGERGSCLIWGMGVTQHTMGTDNARSLINLALLSGQIGGFGQGISPLRGQNNVQGCSDAGCLPDVMPGYEQVSDPAVNARWSAGWGTDLTTEPGLTSTAMIDEMLEGRLRTLYVVGENPLLSDPYLAHARDAFTRLDFLVVQDIFMHETAEIADVVLPALSFAEKQGTFTNSERRVQRVRPIIPGPGEARDDWQITEEIARRVLARLERPLGGFEHDSSADVFDEMAQMTPIVAGLSHERLDREGGIQWPCPEPDHPGTSRLFGEEFPRGLGKFHGRRAGTAGGRAPVPALPLHADHRAHPLPLARRRDHSARGRTGTGGAGGDGGYASR